MVPVDLEPQTLKMYAAPFTPLAPKWIGLMVRCGRTGRRSPVVVDPKVTGRVSLRWGGHFQHLRTMKLHHSQAQTTQDLVWGGGTPARGTGARRFFYLDHPTIRPSPQDVQENNPTGRVGSGGWTPEGTGVQRFCSCLVLDWRGLVFDS